MKLLFCTATLLMLISCRQTDQPNTIVFLKEYPKSFQKDDFSYTLKEKLAQYIGLDSITKPSDSLIFRVWVEQSLIVGTHLYEIKFMSNTWTGTHYYFQEKASDYSYLTKRDYYGVNDEVDSFWMVKRFQPLHGWKSFADTIINSGILKLPDYRDLPVCHIGGFDGSIFIFEWSNKNKYRYYTFWADDNSQCSENVIFQEFRSFLQRQLEIDYCRPNCRLIKNK